MKITVLKDKTISYRNVEGYDPYEYLEPLCDEITGDPVRSPEGIPLICLRVKHLKNWFHKYCESQGNIGAIHTSSIIREDGAHQVHARIYLDYKDASLATETNPDAGAIGSADGYKDPMGESQFEPFQTAQTKAITEALKNAGFGVEVEAAVVGTEKTEKVEIIVVDDDAPDVKDAPDDNEQVPIPSFKVPEAEDARETDNLDAQTDYEDVVPKKKAKKTNAEKKEAPSEEPSEDATSTPDDKETEEPARETEPERPEEIPKEPAADAGDYIITKDDIAPCPGLLMGNLNQPLSSLGKDVASKFLEAFGNEIPEDFKEALTAYVGG